MDGFLTFLLLGADLFFILFWMDGARDWDDGICGKHKVMSNGYYWMLFHDADLRREKALWDREAKPISVI